MKVNYFYSHTLTGRLDILHKEGVFISRIKYYGFYISLYILDQTPVEVYYNIHNRKIEEVELIDQKDDRLHLFTANVDISGLFKT